MTCLSCAWTRLLKWSIFSRSVIALHRSQSSRGAQQPVGQDEGGLQVHPRAPLGRRRLVPQVGRRHLRHRREPTLPPPALQRVEPHLLWLQVQALREAGASTYKDM